MPRTLILISPTPHIPPDLESLVTLVDFPLPTEPQPLPQLAPHLLDRLFENFSNENKPSINRIKTTIDKTLQEKVAEILARRQAIYRGNDIHNMAAVVLNCRTGNVVAYVGNVAGCGKTHGENVAFQKNTLFIIILIIIKYPKTWSIWKDGI